MENFVVKEKETNEYFVVLKVLSGYANPANAIENTIYTAEETSDRFIMANLKTKELRNVEWYLSKIQGNSEKTTFNETYEFVALYSEYKNDKTA